ncbi:MAG TPA: hypothetical protein VKD90_19815 [Gemmataceae bacterium]|nr:hypothetical protein [Gemmataceae bacterium]
MDLYPDTECGACGARHTLYYAARMRKSHRAAYRYTCPTTDAVVVFRPAKDPEPVILAPADAIPMTWVSD